MKISRLKRVLAGISAAAMAFSAICYAPSNWCTESPYVINASALEAEPGYITDSNGIMSYKFLEDEYLVFVDFHGVFDGSWKQITFGDDGFGSVLRVNGTEYSPNVQTGAETEIGLSVKFEPVFVSDGKLIQLVYNVTNKSEESVTFDFANDITDNLQIELDTLSMVCFMKVNTNKTFNGKYHIFAEKDFAAGKAAASTEYTITLDPNGGTLPEGTSNTVTTTANGLIDAYPDEPTREGYTFGGWYTDSVKGKALGIDTKFDGNATLYAQWLDDKIGSEEDEDFVLVTYLENVKLEPVSGDTTGTKYSFSGMPELNQAEIDAGFKYVYSFTPTANAKDLAEMFNNLIDGIGGVRYNSLADYENVSEITENITIEELSSIKFYKVLDFKYFGSQEEKYYVMGEK